MKEEQYNLACCGELVQGFEQSAVIHEIVKLFKVDEVVALEILDKKYHVIMKKLKWHKAIKYRNRLKKIGLVVYVNVILDVDIFRDSLIPVSNQLENRVEKENIKTTIDLGTKKAYQLLTLNVTYLIPTIFSKPHSEIIVCQENKPKFELESYNHFFNPKILLLGSIFLALILQKYFTLTLVHYSTGQVVVYLSLILFFLISIFLPKIMSPNRIFTLRYADGGAAYLLCVQTSSLNPFINNYAIYSNDEELLATVRNHKLKHKIVCRDVDEHILYSSSEEHTGDEVTKDVAIEIKDQLFDFSVLSYINIFFNWLKKIKAWINNEPHIYQRGDAFVVRNKNNKKVAYFYRNNISTIEFPVLENNDNSYKPMIAFLLICVGIA